MFICCLFFAFLANFTDCLVFPFDDNFAILKEKQITMILSSIKIIKSNVEIFHQILENDENVSRAYDWISESEERQFELVDIYKKHPNFYNLFSVQKMSQNPYLANYIIDEDQLVSFEGGLTDKNYYPFQFTPKQNIIMFKAIGANPQKHCYNTIWQRVTIEVARNHHDFFKVFDLVIDVLDVRHMNEFIKSIINEDEVGKIIMRYYISCDDDLFMLRYLKLTSSKYFNSRRSKKETEFFLDKLDWRTFNMKTKRALTQAARLSIDSRNYSKYFLKVLMNNKDTVHQVQLLDTMVDLMVVSNTFMYDSCVFVREKRHLLYKYQLDQLDLICPEQRIKNESRHIVLEELFN